MSFWFFSRLVQLNPLRAPTEGYLPLVNTTRSRKAHWNIKTARVPPALAALLLAALSGILFCLTISSLHFRSALLRLPSPGESTNGHALSAFDSSITQSDPNNLSLEELRNIVGQAKGYWTRDYSLHLGWNNMRYIIEAALLHGGLLNRTVILPSFVYARSCEFDNAVCAAVAEMVNHGDAVHSDEWRLLPIEEQMSWRLPISVMLNMTLLRSTQPVVTVSEYLRLHDLSEDIEESDGHWSRHSYHTHPYIFDDKGRAPTLHVIQNDWYDWGVNRVDMIPDEMKKRGGWSADGGDPEIGETGRWTDVHNTSVSIALQAALPEQPQVLEWDQARQILQEEGYTWLEHEDENMEKLLNENGWEVLHTYLGALGMDYMKTVVSPVRQVALRQSLRGLREDYGHLDADVLLLEGEVHHMRKPGALRFTTVARQNLFSRLVLHHVRATDKVYELAATLAARMKEKNEGRMWLGAHMRRGDFVRISWAMGNTVASHLSKIQEHLAAGLKVLRSLRTNDLRTYRIPDVTPDYTITQSPPPLNTDKFYLSTDERNPSNIAYLVEHGAVLVSNLLTIDDRRAFGWPLLFTDVLGLVEQAVLAEASYFGAHGLSSFAGGAINMRAVAGLDPRTAAID